VNPRAAIGLFDSGLGGLTVAREIAGRLPRERIIYFGDTARCPYGSRPAGEVRKFALQLIKFLAGHDIKMVVMACNTSSATALAVAQERFDFPVLGMIKPGVRAAVKRTRNKRIGVIATGTTVANRAYSRAARAMDPSVEVKEQACPRFVPLVEVGDVHGERAHRSAREYLQPLKEFGMDTLILGCTHYPLLEKVIRDHIEDKVILVDPSVEVVEETRLVLERNGALNPDPGPPEHLLYTSGDPERFRLMGERVYGASFGRVYRVDVQSWE